MTKPLVQIDNEIREMTDEEHAQYLASMGTTNEYPELLTELEPTEPLEP